MKAPKFTDRTKLYVGLYQYFETNTRTLAVTIDNTDDHLNIGNGRTMKWPIIGDNNSLLVSYTCMIEPISCPLTLSKLAEVIRSTKVEGFTYLLVMGRTFIWAKNTPDGFILSNGRVIKVEPSMSYCNSPLEWFVDWREALSVLMKRLNERLQKIRDTGKARRLEYAEFIKAQTAIDTAQAVEVRINNKRFKGIPF